MVSFKPGAVVFVQRIGAKAKAPSLLLGAKGKEYLFIDAPFVGEYPLFNKPGEECVVRLLSKGKIYGFRSRVAKMLHDPFPMLVLEYPKNFETRNLRGNTRLDCNIPARLRPENRPSNGEADPAAAERPLPKLPHFATISNLSETGFRVALPIFSAENAGDFPDEIPFKSRDDYRQDFLKTVYRSNDLVRLDFTLPPKVGKKCEDVAAEVRWATGFKGQNLFMGIQLLEPEETLLTSIRKTIEFQSKYFVSRYPTS